MKRLIVFALASAMMLAACGNGGSADELRATAQAAGVAVAPTTAPPSAPTLQPAQPLPTETPDYQPEQPEPAQTAQPAVEPPPTAAPLPTIAPVIPTATPDIQNFAAPPADIAPGIDESAQPCPASFWKRGRCTATAAQMEAYAAEAQP